MQHRPEVTSEVTKSSSSEVNQSFDQSEKMLEDQDEVMNQVNKEIEDSIDHAPPLVPFVTVMNSGLKAVETNNSYKISIDLKPFNKDVKNVDVQLKGNKVFISASYKSKNNREFSSSSFRQVLTFPVKVDSLKVKQQKTGDFLVITIPKK